MTVSHWPRRDHHTLAPPPMIQPRFWQRVALGWRVPISHVRRKAVYVATPLGFEPRITPPKGAVLPLHHGVSRFRILDWRFWIKSQSAKSEGATPRPNDDSPIQETSLYFRFDFMKELSVENLHVTIADQEIV